MEYYDSIIMVQAETPLNQLFREHDKIYMTANHNILFDK